MNTNHEGLTKYLSQVAQSNRITHEEEKTATPKQLVMSNLRLVIHVAKRWAYDPEDLLDRIQDGNIGLMEAAQKFDSSFGVHFSTYAVHYIMNRIRRGHVSSSRVVRMSQRAYCLYRQAYDLLDQGLSYKEVAKSLGINEDEVASMFVYGQESLTEFPELSDGQLCEIDTDMIHILLKAQRVLTAKEIKLLEDLCSGHTIEEIAAERGQSRETVRKSKMSSIHKLSGKYVRD